MLKKLSRENIHYGWITYWLWLLTTRKIYHSYYRIHSRVMTYLVVKTFSPPHIVPDKGEIVNDNQKQASEIK